jgi:hypothetical protein
VIVKAQLALGAAWSRTDLAPGRERRRGGIVRVVGRETLCAAFGFSPRPDGFAPVGPFRVPGPPRLPSRAGGPQLGMRGNIGAVGMEHRLLFGNEAYYEAAILDIFQKSPPTSSVVSITLHEAGKAGGAYTVHEAWPRGKSAADIAKLVAHRIVGEYKSHVGQVFKGITLDF